jgi:hypothetical protein
MIDAAIRRVSVDDWWSVLLIAGAVFVFLLGGATVFFAVKERTVTRTVKVEKDWGKVDQTVPASALNAQLQCDVYLKRQVAVCHP